MRTWWQSNTLRFRLAVWYAVVGSLLLAAFSATLYFYVARAMGRPLDLRLQLDLDTVKRHLKVGADGRITWNGLDPADFGRWTRPLPSFELWDEHNHLVRRLWPFHGDEVKKLPSAPSRGRTTISVFSVGPDLRLRTLSVPYQVPGRSAPWMLRVIRIHRSAVDALGSLRWIIFIALPTVIALLVVGGYSVTRRWLKPLDRMTSEANHITADDLNRRLPVENPHDEPGRLATVFNVTLDRLQASFLALDRFVADASHELRTPLTTLRNVGEVGLRRSRTVEEYREIIGSMLEEAQRLEDLIDHLLELAKAEGGATHALRSKIRVDECVAGCVNELGILAEAKDQRIVLDTEACSATTDPVILHQAVQNLVDNAIKYSPKDSIIRVTVGQTASGVHIAVRDQGPGINAENQANLTQRFFRPDRGRGRASGGFGLGLSITKAYMGILGGALEFESLSPQGSVFRLILPNG